MDLAHALTADSTGVYITGITFSPDFPTYFGTCKRGANDVFVTKLDPQGALVYSSGFGGTSIDDASAIAADAAKSLGPHRLSYKPTHRPRAEKPAAFLI